MYTNVLKSGLLIGLFCLVGCKKFVQIDPPTTFLVTASVFDNSASATAAQTVIYSKMVNNSESANMAVNLGLLSDELKNYIAGNVAYSQYYLNAMHATQGGGPWTNGYNYIYQANAIIAALQNNSSLPRPVINQLSGEAQFIRAFWLFYLTNLYGNIPLVTSTNYISNANISRTDKSKVFQQIIADLKNAKTLMNANYISADDTTVTTSARTRPNRWAAEALLARVYLYQGDNVGAEAEADSVINNTSLFSLLSNLGSVFLVNSREAIWQLDIPQPSNYNTPDGNQFILLSPPGGASGCCAISQELMSAFESGDKREANWIDSIQSTTSPVVTYYYAYKYKVKTSTVVKEDVMVLRLAEQYLIRSEARARQGNLGGAISDLNTIRTRAGLNNYSGSIDQQSVLNAILHERQVELFSEWGHRWLDLIRTNIVDSVMSVVTPIKGGTWNSNGNQLLFPIPQAEISLDVNLTQNPGY